jgi:hypothetical protein
MRALSRAPSKFILCTCRSRTQWYGTIWYGATIQAFSQLMNKQVVLNSYISRVNSSSFYNYDLSEVNGTMGDQAIMPSSPSSHNHLGHHTHQSLWHNVYTLGPQKNARFRL